MATSFLKLLREFSSLYGYTTTRWTHSFYDNFDLSPPSSPFAFLFQQLLNTQLSIRSQFPCLPRKELYEPEKAAILFFYMFCENFYVFLSMRASRHGPLLNFTWWWWRWWTRNIIISIPRTTHTHSLSLSLSLSSYKCAISRVSKKSEGMES